MDVPRRFQKLRTRGWVGRKVCIARPRPGFGRCWEGHVKTIQRIDYGNRYGLIFWLDGYSFLADELDWAGTDA